MNNTLKTINIIVRVAKIFSLIAYICIMVSAILSLLGIALLSVGITDSIRIGQMTIHSIIFNNTGMLNKDMIAGLTVLIIVCIFNGVLSGYAYKCFKDIEEEGTPFTFNGAYRMKKLGILTIVMPLAGIIVSSIIGSIISNIFSCMIMLEIDNEDSVMVGIILIVISVILKYVAELKENEKNDIVDIVNENP